MPNVEWRLWILVDIGIFSLLTLSSQFWAALWRLWTPDSYLFSARDRPHCLCSCQPPTMNGSQGQGSSSRSPAQVRPKPRPFCWSASAFKVLHEKKQGSGGNFQIKIAVSFATSHSLLSGSAQTALCKQVQALSAESIRSGIEISHGKMSLRFCSDFWVTIWGV